MSDVEILPTVVLEHARTGQPIVVDQRDYMARKDGRYANWRLLGHGDFIAPPPLPSESPDDANSSDTDLDGILPGCNGLAMTLSRPAGSARAGHSKPGRRRSHA
ncbi:MAG: hypothetical protein P1U88_06025 [Thalassobaculaceae bacterium]|nr:hypothetical protein [Thalassobaculaceae bacterium]